MSQLDRTSAAAQDWAHNEAYERGATLFESGAYPASIVAFREALGVQPERPRIHTNLARALYESGESGAALEAVAKASSLGPGDLYVLQTRIWMLDENGEHRAIVELCDRSLAREDIASEDRSELIVARVIALVNDGDAHAAISAGLKEGPSSRDPKLWAAFAMALAHASRWGEALAALRRAVALDPSPESDYGPRLGALGRAIAGARGELKGAVSRAGETPQSWEAHFEIGRLHLGLGELREALVAFQAAKRCVPEPPEDFGLLPKLEFDCSIALRAAHELDLSRAEETGADDDADDDDDDIPF